MIRHLNIKLFSEKAGYSVATVSRALNPQTAAMVKPQTRQKIQQLAAELNFVPNPGARVLRRTHPAPLAILMRAKEDLFLSEYYSRLLMGILAEASKNGQAVHAMAFKPESGNFIHQLNEATVGCEGIVYLSDPLTVEMQLQLERLHRPFVCTPGSLIVGMDESNSRIPVFGLGELAGGRLVAQHLIDLGHRQIGYVGGPATNHDANQRKAGFDLALSASGLAPRRDWQFEGTFDFESGARLAEQIHALLPDVTAVVCASDELALGLIYELSQFGVICPRDLSVTGYDDLRWSSRHSPSLTTVRQPLRRMAAVSIQMIAALKAGKAVKNELFAPELIVRGSSIRLA